MQSFSTSSAIRADFLSPRGTQVFSTVGTATSIFNFSTLVIGGGLLGWPNMFKLGGWFGGSLCLCGMCLMCGYTMCAMVNCAITLKTMSYEETCCAMWGRPGYYIVALVCFLIDFGVLVAYFVAMGSLAGPIATDYFSITEDVETKVKLAAAVVMLPPSYLRSLGDIPGWSYVSYGMIVFGSFSMLYLAFSDSTQEFNKTNVAPLNVPVETDWRWVKGGIWQAVGTIAFTFAIHDCVFSIFKSLKEGTRQQWSFVCYTALWSTTALILAIGVPIYFALGDKVASEITANFPSGPLMNAVRGAIFVCIIITWIYVQHVGRKYLHSLVMPLVRCRPLTSSETYTMSVPELAVFTTVIFVAALYLGIAVKDLGIPMSLTGIFAQSLSAFVIPPCLVFTMVRQGQNPGYNKMQLGFLAAILLFGLVSCTLGMANTLNAHLAEYAGHGVVYPGEGDQS